MKNNEIDDACMCGGMQVCVFMKMDSAVSSACTDA